MQKIVYYFLNKIFMSESEIEILNYVKKKKKLYLMLVVSEEILKKDMIII